MFHQILSYYEDVLKLYEKLVGEDWSLKEIQTVTIYRPNGFGSSHPAYLVMWEK